MSLYNHVNNKEDLYDGMIDFVFSEIPISEEDLDWKDHLRQLSNGTITHFGRHPWVAHLLMRQGNFGPGALHFMNHALGLLGDVGFDDENAHHAWQMMTLLQRDFPNVARITPYLIDCAWEEEYMFGLEIILAGLESRLG